MPKIIRRSSPFHTSLYMNFDKPFVIKDYLKFIIEVACYRHPTNTKKRFKLLLRSLFWFRQTALWYKHIVNSSLLSALVLTLRGLLKNLINAICVMITPLMIDYISLSITILFSLATLTFI